MNILVFEEKEIHPKALDLLLKHGVHIFYSLNSISPDEVEAVFLRTYTTINQKFIRKFPNLLYVLRAGVGLDNIDVQACTKKGITIFNSPASNADAVAEMVVCFSLMLLRNISVHSAQLLEGGWREKCNIGTDLRGKTFGLVGCGATGKALAKKLRAFSLHKILGFDPYISQSELKKMSITKVGLPELLQNSDVISLHVPLLPETQHLISKKELSLMKNTSFLINTSRGRVIDEKDLFIALHNRTIAGAALDVYENEPHLTEEGRSLVTCPYVIATPHIASYTKETDEAMCVEVVKRFLSTIRAKRKFKSHTILTLPQARKL